MPAEAAPPECAVDPDGHARRVLEYDKVLAAVAAEARTPGGEERVQARRPLSDAAVVREEQAAVQEVRRALDEGLAPWPLEVAADARLLLDQACLPGARLEPAELRRVADTLAGATRLRRLLDEQRERVPLLRARSAGLADHGALTAAIDAAIDGAGELREDASPALRALRRELQAQRSAILSQLESLLRRGGESADAYVTLRAERYVIPVRTEHSNRVPGIVHDRSASGSTLFVEPLEVLDANNELQRRRDAERREMLRILSELTGRVAADGAAAAASLAALEVVDELQARALWAQRQGAASPRLGARVRLRAARHPLLEERLRSQGQHAVPLDVDLVEAQGLVVTGPNAGGKTVALKTVGLLALLHQAGVPIPAGPDSELPVFARIVADIGDEQSIESAESTFSSHLRHVQAAVQAAGPRTLVLLDELMAGTDPEEGAALARVVLRRLVERGASTLVTTHLAALKLFAHTEPGLANAGMEFDTTSRTPRFRLQQGVPGSSNAIAIAERVGLDPELLLAARSERGEAAGRLESALAALEEERTRLAASRDAAESAAAEARRMREEHATALAALTGRRREALAQARREAADLVSRARARVEEAVLRVRAERASGESVRAARSGLREVLAEVDAGAEAAAPPPEVSDEPARPGDPVWVRSLGRDGILEEVDAGGRALVRLGNVALRVAASEVLRLTAREGGVAVPAASGGYAGPDSSAPAATRLDLRGMERGEALAALGAFLDRMLLQGVDRSEIVHGKGTGVLRRAVAEFLARHPQVSGYRLGEHGEGGSGVTIVTLR
jgi:DNA mismatch repair protein MutS2